MINKVIKLKLQYFKHAYVQATCQRDPEVYVTCHNPKILTPNLGFLPQIIYRYALGSTLLELKPEGNVTVTRKQLVTRQGPRCIYIPNMELLPYIIRGDLMWGHFFQELTSEIKVTVAENSERHSMTPTYIYKLNLRLICHII